MKACSGDLLMKSDNEHEETPEPEIMDLCLCNIGAPPAPWTLQDEITINRKENDIN